METRRVIATMSYDNCLANPALMLIPARQLAIMLPDAELDWEDILWKGFQFCLNYLVEDEDFPIEDLSEWPETVEVGMFGEDGTIYLALDTGHQVHFDFNSHMAPEIDAMVEEGLKITRMVMHSLPAEYHNRGLIFERPLYPNYEEGIAEGILQDSSGRDMAIVTVNLEDDWKIDIQDV